MTDSVSEEGSYERIIFDTIPSPVFVADGELRILDANRAAVQRYGEIVRAEQQNLCGDVLRCVHAVESADGCGTTDLCPQCVIRNSVAEALAGDGAVRKKSEMLLEVDGREEELVFLVTTARFHHDGTPKVLVILEDITELMELRGIIPICAGCKKIRTDEQFWEHVDTYFTKHSDVKFTHGLCPDCARKMYPEQFID